MELSKCLDEISSRREELRRRIAARDAAAKRAGGVYYTPGYVVDYIVQRTLGPLLQAEPGPGDAAGAGRWKTPEQAAPLRVLDPACGCGAFLVGAYRYLLEWHRDRYLEGDPQRYGSGRHPALYRNPAGNWQLTIAEKSRILRNNIFGVDVDRQAVEAARLALVWITLEDAPAEANAGPPCPPQAPELPDLSRSIKCGNALIGPDSDRAKDDPRPAKVPRGIEPFDWPTEFPQAFGGHNPGFDAVIGNPPYRRELGHKRLLDAVSRTPWGKRYRTPRMDLWYYFVHRGLELLKPGGVLSYIVSSYWTSGAGAEKLIATLRDEAHVDELFCVDDLEVFVGVSGRHLILRLTNQTDTRPVRIRMARGAGHETAQPFFAGTAPVSEFEKTPAELFRETGLDLEPPADEVLARIEAGEPLGRLGIVRQGIAENPPCITKIINARHGNRWRTGQGVFALSDDEVRALRLPESEQALLRPYHDLRDVGRYFLAGKPSLALIYSTPHTCPDIDTFPRLKRHLRRYRAIMMRRRETRNGTNRWWHLHWPRDEGLWRSAKILSVQMSARPAFAPAPAGVYVPFSINVFVPSAETREGLEYLCGLLNSRLLWKWYRHHAKRRGVGLEINGRVLVRTPIRRIDFSDRADTARHDEISRLVRMMIDLNRRLAATESRRANTTIQHQLATTDRAIDRLVYDLYGLGDGDIARVEATTQLDA